MDKVDSLEKYYRHICTWNLEWMTIISSIDEVYYARVNGCDEDYSYMMSADYHCCDILDHYCQCVCSLYPWDRHFTLHRLSRPRRKWVGTFEGRFVSRDAKIHVSGCTLPGSWDGYPDIFMDCKCLMPREGTCLDVDSKFKKDAFFYLYIHLSCSYPCS